MLGSISLDEPLRHPAVASPIFTDCFFQQGSSFDKAQLEPPGLLCLYRVILSQSPIPINMATHEPSNYTLQGSKFPRVKLQFVAVKLITRELTGNFNWDQYTIDRIA